VARELWVALLYLFGVEWVVPKKAIRLLASCRGQEAIPFKRLGG
jgi:hypothetical protein